VLDILWKLQNLVGRTNHTYQVISGYRSPATNAKLRKRSKGVAKHSLHMQGKAIDVRLEGMETRPLYLAARSLRRRLLQQVPLHPPRYRPRAYLGQLSS